MKVDYRPHVPDILQRAADEVTSAGDFDLADHLRDLASDYANPMPVLALSDMAADGPWKENQ